MSKRNFILLIIVLIVVMVAIFGFLYFRPNTTTPNGKDQDTNFISRFNPFGSSPTTTPETETPPIVDVEEFPSGFSEEAPMPKLIKVSSMPIAGFTVFVKEREKKEFVTATRYVEKATGNIYQTFADQIVEQKFSGTIIPKVYEAYFGNQGQSVVMRYLKTDEKTIETFVGTLPKEQLSEETNQNNEVKGSFLPDNIRDVSVSSDALKIFYLFDSGNGIIGTTLNFLTNKKVQLFSSPFTEWLSQWVNDKKITLTTKPSSNVLGYMYSIDGSGKNLTKILGGIAGLTTLTSPNGKLVLYSGNNLSLNVYHTDTRNSDTLGIKTLPEKCIWSDRSDAVYCAVPKSIVPSDYPDSWYQGEVSFDDQIWKIDVESRNTTIISDPATVAGWEGVDGIKLAIDKGENYLFFVNKKDSFLWKLDLK